MYPTRPPVEITVGTSGEPVVEIVEGAPKPHPLSIIPLRDIPYSRPTHPSHHPRRAIEYRPIAAQEFDPQWMIPFELALEFVREENRRRNTWFPIEMDGAHRITWNAALPGRPLLRPALLAPAPVSTHNPAIVIVQPPLPHRPPSAETCAPTVSAVAISFVPSPLYSTDCPGITCPFGDCRLTGGTFAHHFYPWKC